METWDLMGDFHVVRHGTITIVSLCMESGAGDLPGRAGINTNQEEIVLADRPVGPESHTFRLHVALPGKQEHGI